MLSGTPLVLVFLLTMILLLVILIKFKVSPICSLIFASIFFGILSGMPITGVSSAISTGFGNTMKSLGLVLAFGTIFGIFLTESGGTEELAKFLLRKFGPKKDFLAIALTGFIISIPVFFGAAYNMLAPLTNTLSQITRKKIAGYSCALFTGLIITHCLVPPTPGPVAVAGILGADIGFIILYGCITGLIAVLTVGWLYANYVGRTVGEIYCAPGEERAEIVRQMVDDHMLDRNPDNPPAGLVIFLILLPAVMIMIGTFLGVLAPDGAVSAVFQFLGQATIALFIAMLLTGVAVGKYLKGADTLWTRVESMADRTGNILLIVGVGGCFGQVITESGMADTLVEIMQKGNIPMIPLCFLLAIILRACIGSATVAVLTSANIAGVAAVAMGYSPTVITLAICAGAVGLALPTDGGFWIAVRGNNIDMKTALKGITIPTTIASLIVLAMVFLLNTFQGVLPGI